MYLDGVHGDCSKTFLIGDVDDNGKRLVNITEECLQVSQSKSFDENIYLAHNNIRFTLL